MFEQYDKEDSYQRVIVKEFNEKCKREGKDINLTIEIATPEYASKEIDSNGSTLAYILYNHLNTYDIFLCPSAYSKKFGYHLVDLREYLSEDDYKGFDKSILDNACLSKDKKLIGLVMFIYIYYLIHICSFIK